MAIIAEKSELTSEFLLNLFDEAGFTPKADEDGDLYVAGEGAVFPFWIAPAPSEGLIKIFTYIRMRLDVTLEEAIAFANNANTNIILPSFFIHQKNNGEIFFWADCVLAIEFGIDTRTIIATARRFAGAFHYALSCDDDHFFASRQENANETAIPRRNSLVH